MEIIEIKCRNCRRKIYIEPGHVRESMFCTLGCMNSYEANSQKTDFN